MALTAYGQQQRQRLIDLTNIGNEMLAVLRPIVEKIPAVVIKRTKDTGSGAKGAYSPYSKFYPKTGKKDFWVTGKMWGSYKIQEEDVAASKITFTLGSEGVVGSNGQELVDIHSATRTKHVPGGTQGESQNILDITDEEWTKVENAMFDAFKKELYARI